MTPKKYIHPKNGWKAIEDNNETGHFWIHAYKNCMVDFAIKEDDLKALGFVEEVDVFEECFWKLRGDGRIDSKKFISVGTKDPEVFKDILKQHFQHYVDAYNGKPKKNPRQASIVCGGCKEELEHGEACDCRKKT